MNGIDCISRRSFLGGAAALALGACSSPQIVPSSVLGRDGRVAPSERITLGIIGVGDHGVNRNLKRFLPEPDVQVVAVCDVDSERRQKAKAITEEHYGSQTASGTYRGCASYNDFRELIDRKDIDAVMNATPDHWHVIPSVMAARAGKDVMCEKPLTLTVHEGRVLSDVIKRHRRIFQTASENRSLDVYHRMAELVRNGRIGKLHTIRVSLPGGFWDREESMETQLPPKGFDYNLWLGQAPYKPYCPARTHWNFRYILDYSGGMLTDWGHHIIDIAQWGNDTEYTGPVEVEGEGEFPQDGLYNTTTSFHVRYRYANGVRLIVTSRQPAIRFEGSDGWIGNEGWNAELQASSSSILGSQIGPNETHLYTCPAGEQRNFLDCIKSRKPCYTPAEVGHRSVTISHIGNISMMLGRKLRWNPGKERFVDDLEADGLLKRAMREPWVL